MFKIFDESSQDVYLREEISVQFPIKFCETCWMRDGKLAECVLEIWDSKVVAAVKFWEVLCKSKQPKDNKSYDTLVTHHQDLLMSAKFSFYTFIAGI